MESRAMNELRDLFFRIFEASQVSRVEHFDHMAFQLAKDLGYLETFRAKGARHTDSRAYERWKAEVLS
jgi:hypothetical protein